MTDRATTEREDVVKLREAAHKARIMACGAWSDVIKGGDIDEAACRTASDLEQKLAAAIDRLAGLSAAPVEPARLTDEREAFEASAFDFPPMSWGELKYFPGGLPREMQDYFWECGFAGWQARAALASRTPEVKEVKA